MTFEEPPRPRSTPLPGPGAAGSPPPPPPGAPSGPPPPQGGGTPPPPSGFGSQPTTQMPSMPPGPPTAQIPMQPSGPMAPVVPGPGEPKRGISPIWIVAVVAAVLLIGGGIVVALRSGDDDKDADVESTATNTTVARTLPDGSTIPDITVPTTVPKITLPPGVTLPGGVTLPDITLPDISIPDFTIPQFTLPPGVTLPPGITLPVITLPPGVTLPPGITLPQLTLPSSGDGLPNGARSIFDQAATGTVVGDLEAYLPGDPTQLTEVVLYPTYAIASAQDPSDPENVVGALWRNGKAGSGPTLSPSDIEGRLFTRADVNWDAVSSLVAQAPTLLGDPSDEVTHVIVQRWDFDPELPVRILVYAGGGYVEAAADGTVVTTH